VSCLAAVDPAGFRLGRDAQAVAVRDQLFGARQVLGLLVVRHVDHDAVELARPRSVLDPLFALRVVEVQAHRHARAAADVRGEVDQVVVRVFLRPGEEQDLAGGVFRFGGFAAGDDGFEVVADDAGDAVVAFLGGFEDPDGDVLGEVGHLGREWRKSGEGS